MRVVDVSQKASSAYRRATVLSYGASRTGKTRFAATWPRPLFLSVNIEGGWETIQNMPADLWYEPSRAPDVWAIESAQDMLTGVNQLRDIVKKDPTRYLTVVVDSLTYHADVTFWAMVNAMRSANSGRDVDTRKLYGVLYENLVNLRNELHSLPLNVLWLCIESPPSDDEPLGGPTILGQARYKFPPGCNYFFYHRLTRPDPRHPSVYEIRTRQYTNYRAGGRDEDKLPDPMTRGTYREMADCLGIASPIPQQTNVQQARRVVVPTGASPQPGR